MSRGSNQDTHSDVTELVLDLELHLRNDRTALPPGGTLMQTNFDFREFDDGNLLIAAKKKKSRKLDMNFLLYGLLFLYLN